MGFDHIEKWCDEICEELDGAMDYTEMYLGAKESNRQHAQHYHEMAEDELKHAGYLMEMAAAEMKDMEQEPEAVWNYEHSRMEKKRQKIRNMLAM